MKIEKLRSVLYLNDKSKWCEGVFHKWGKGFNEESDKHPVTIAIIEDVNSHRIITSLPEHIQFTDHIYQTPHSNIRDSFETTKNITNNEQ